MQSPSRVSAFGPVFALGLLAGVGGPRCHRLAYASGLLLRALLGLFQVRPGLFPVCSAAGIFGKSTMG